MHIAIISKSGVATCLIPEHFLLEVLCCALFGRGAAMEAVAELRAIAALLSSVAGNAGASAAIAQTQLESFSTKLDSWTFTSATEQAEAVSLVMAMPGWSGDDRLALVTRMAGGQRSTTAAAAQPRNYRPPRENFEAIFHYLKQSQWDTFRDPTHIAREVCKTMRALGAAHPSEKTWRAVATIITLSMAGETTLPQAQAFLSRAKKMWNERGTRTTCSTATITDLPHHVPEFIAKYSDVYATVFATETPALCPLNPGDIAYWMENIKCRVHAGTLARMGQALVPVSAPQPDASGALLQCMQMQQMTLHFLSGGRVPLPPGVSIPPPSPDIPGITIFGKSSGQHVTGCGNAALHGPRDAPSPETRCFSNAHWEDPAVLPQVIDAAAPPTTLAIPGPLPASATGDGTRERPDGVAAMAARLGEAIVERNAKKKRNKADDKAPAEPPKKKHKKKEAASDADVEDEDTGSTEEESDKDGHTDNDGDIVKPVMKKPASKTGGKGNSGVKLAIYLAEYRKAKERLLKAGKSSKGASEGARKAAKAACAEK